MLVILPDSGHDLLRRELAHAFTDLGFEVRRAHPQAFLDSSSPDYLPRLLELGPDLFFSVNLQGLLPGGAVPKILHEAGVPVLGWFVDNPWHVLSGMRDPSWKNFYLAVTDHTFVEPLQQAASKLRRLSGEEGWPGLPSSTPGAEAAALTGGRVGSVEAAGFAGLSVLAGPGPACPPGLAEQGGVPGVFHMPLAACPRCIEESKAYKTLRGEEQSEDFDSPSGEFVFAGRSVFPEYASYFAGQSIPPELLREADELCAAGVRTDFAWWSKRMGLPGERGFWPGKTSRPPGLGAAASNRIWRRQRLTAAMAYGLTLYGDEGWLPLICDAGVSLSGLVNGEKLNEAGSGAEGGTQTGDGSGVCSYSLDLRPQFDYYAHIYGVYNSAPFTLNLNSLLMSAGLTQRIFDVWLADGFCLTDNSPGLRIFPDELASAVTFNRPDELIELMRGLAAAPRRKEELRRAWKSEILEKHTYRKRLESLLGELRQSGALR